MVVGDIATQPKQGRQPVPLNSFYSFMSMLGYGECKQWKGINRKQGTRWQHLSRLKASAFFSLQKKFSCYETQQLILGTGTAIWWVTEPHLTQIFLLNEIRYH